LRLAPGSFSLARNGPTLAHKAQGVAREGEIMARKVPRLARAAGAAASGRQGVVSASAARHFGLSRQARGACA